MKKMIAVLSVLGLAGLMTACAHEPKPIETVSRPLAAVPSADGALYAGRLDDGPAAVANPGPSWTVLTVEELQHRTRYFDPRTGLMITKTQNRQTVREDPWLAAPIKLPDTRGEGQDLRYHGQRGGHGGGE
ncbi:MAG: hypothetical protein RIG82_13225 [Phycisphaeraceae bacterium]